VCVLFTRLLRCVEVFLIVGREFVGRIVDQFDVFRFEGFYLNGFVSLARSDKAVKDGNDGMVSAQSL
jgi:hypothetical protein